MEIVTLFFIPITIAYTLFIGLLMYGFSKVKPFIKSEVVAKTSFSIVVPFRNEEKNLPALLHSFSQLIYPKHLFEIILVDDESEDHSVAIINNWKAENKLFQLTVLENLRTSNSPKKDAITNAVSIAKCDWIITTDADCEVKKNWLQTFDTFIQKKEAEMVVGAVSYPTKGGLLSHFQQMDLLSLQGATIGSFGLQKAFMCNGANLAYAKKLFFDLNGFEGNNKIASGDDVFLLQKAVLKSPDKVHYLKNSEAIVVTKTEDSWLQLFRQRVRWASKAGAYQTNFSKGLAIVVFAMNLSLVFGCLLVACVWMYWYCLLMVFSVKFVLDFMLMYKTNKFLRMRLYSAIVSSLIYPFFSSAVALCSLFGKYEWKGRTFRV